MNRIIISEEQSKDFCSQLFQKIGASREHADIVAEHLTMAELRGLASHGLSRIPFYTAKLEHGGYNKNPSMKVLKEHDSTALLDADDALGAVSGKYALELCIKKARKAGCASVAVTHANHYGFLAYYTMMAAEQNMIGFTMCNAGASTAIWGTNERVLGTNPFSVAIPANKKRPIVYDGATSVVAQGKVAVAQIENKPIPGHWAFNKSGKPTTIASEAIAGTMRPFGDYKGSGIAILISLICAGLGGVAFDMEEENLRRIKDLSAGSDLSHFFTVIDISAFTDVESFKNRVDTFIDIAKKLNRAPGFDEIYMPGEIEFNKTDYFRAQGGFEIGPNLFSELKTIGDKYGLKYDMNVWVCD